MRKVFILMVKAVWSLLSCVISFVIINGLFELRDSTPHSYEDPIWEITTGTILLGILIICIAELGFTVINKFNRK